jgi:hypothetical protein
MTIGETRTSTSTGSDADRVGGVAPGALDGVAAAVDGRWTPAGRLGRDTPFTVVCSALLSPDAGAVDARPADGSGAKPSPQAGGEDGAQVRFAQGCVSLAGAEDPPTSNTPTPSAAPPSTATTIWMGVIRQVR